MTGSEPEPTTDGPQRPLSPALRALLVAAGSIALALGILGIFLPVLPTTPFVLVAAACYARASPRLHAWLLSNRTFGPIILEWERHRSIPYRVKWTAIAMMTVTFGASIIFFVNPLWLKAVLGLFGVGLAVWMARIPSRDRPARADRPDA
ncbi:MAG: YbaN family protein [Burkholderiaceae bacterium]